MRKLHHSLIGWTSSKRTMSLSLFAEGLYKHNKQRNGSTQNDLALWFSTLIHPITHLSCSVYIYKPTYTVHSYISIFSTFLTIHFDWFCYQRDRFCPKNLLVLCHNFINWTLPMHVYHTSHPHAKRECYKISSFTIPKLKVITKSILSYR